MALAAIAIGTYYWFAADTVTTAFDMQGIVTVVIRVAALALVLVWLRQALRRANSGNAHRVPVAV